MNCTGGKKKLEQQTDFECVMHMHRPARKSLHCLGHVEIWAGKEGSLAGAEHTYRMWGGSGEVHVCTSHQSQAEPRLSQDELSRKARAEVSHGGGWAGPILSR